MPAVHGQRLVGPRERVATAGPDGAFVYTPDAGYYGSDKFSYEIRDANQALMATSVVLVVVDKPPCVAVDDAYSTTVDTTLTVAAPGVLGNDFVCPDASLFQVAQPPADGAVTMQSDGSFEYIPDPGFVGQDSFTYEHLKFDTLYLDYVVLDTATVLIDVTETPVTTTTTVPRRPRRSRRARRPPRPCPATPPRPRLRATAPPRQSRRATPTTTTGDGGDATTTVPGSGPETPPSTLPEAEFRIATFNASLHRAAEGELVDDLSTPDDQQAANVAAILQQTRPDIVLLTEFDYDEGGAAVDLFRTNYLLLSHNGAQPIDYPYFFIAPSNTGVPSGFDLDNDGTVGGPNDALGFGEFPGQYGMVVLSRFPIVDDQVRTFQDLLWASVPGARLPDDPATAEPADWYSPDELSVLPLSSKSHWDVPIDVDGRIVHVLAAHPTPPGSTGRRTATGCATQTRSGSGRTTSPVSTPAGSSTTPEAAVVSPPTPSS